MCFKITSRVRWSFETTGRVRLLNPGSGLGFGRLEKEKSPPPHITSWAWQWPAHWFLPTGSLHSRGKRPRRNLGESNAICLKYVNIYMIYIIYIYNILHNCEIGWEILKMDSKFRVDVYINGFYIRNIILNVPVFREFNQHWPLMHTYNYARLSRDRR